MILGTIHFQRRLIRKIYFASKKNNFTEKVRISLLGREKNKDKVIYFLKELESQGYLEIVYSFTTSQQDKHRIMLIPTLFFTPYWVKLTEKGQYFFPVLINNYVETFVKSVVIPIIASIITSIITYNLMR